MKNISINYYQEKWHNSILEIWEDSVLHTHSFLSNKDFLFIKGLLSNFDFNSIHIECLFLHDHCIGFAGVHHQKLEMLFLDPSYIGKGYGKYFIHYLIEKYAFKYVDVNEQNLQAVEFYQRVGFKTYRRKEMDDLGLPYPILEMRF